MEKENKNLYQVALDNAISDIKFYYNDYGEDVLKERLKEIELLQELINKETPMQIDKKTITVFVGNILYNERWEGYCPRCNSIVKQDFCEEKINYCSYCGQKLNWQQNKNEE